MVRAGPAAATPAAPSRRAAAWSSSFDRMNRIVEIDEANLIAVVEPNVITGDLQDAVGEASDCSIRPIPRRSGVRDRRQCGRVRGRAARIQGRDDKVRARIEAVLPTGEMSKPAARSSRTSSATT